MHMMQLRVTDTDKMQKALVWDQTHPGFKPTLGFKDLVLN